MSQWIYIGLFIIVGLIIPVGAITVAWILGPKKANPIKMTTYECGIETVGDSWVQFKAQYYIFALVFLVFDVETVFLFPWAVKLGQLGLFAVVEGIIFIAGTAIYLHAKKDGNQSVTWKFWSLVVFLVAIHIMNLLGPPPPSVTMIAWAGQLQWLIVLWAWWADR